MAAQSLDPARFRQMIAGEAKDDKCSMCGRFCAIKVFRGEDD
jgi:thiamine biosynthesis protein ThiC